MKHFQLTTFFVFFVISCLYAQDTIIYETTFYESGRLKFFKQEKKVSAKPFEEIMITGGKVWKTTYNYLNDTIYYTRLMLTPHYSAGQTEGNFIAISSDPPDTIFYGENNEIHPCPCLISAYPIQFFKLQKVLNCQLDTFRLEKFVVIFDKDSLLRKTFKQKNSNYELESKEYYDTKDRRIREETFCDTSSVQYDSLDRKLTEEFIYHCDNSRYQSFYKYEKNIQLVYSTNNGKTRLVEKNIMYDSNRFERIVYHSDSDYTKTIYEIEGKPLSEKRYKRGKLVESYNWEYLFDKLLYTELIIKKKDGIEISRVIKKH